MSLRDITVRTDSDGAFTYERLFRGLVRGVEVDLGTLETPDIAITDSTYGTSVYSGTGVAASEVTFPDVVCMGVLRVAVTGGGATKRGHVRLLYEG